MRAAKIHWSEINTSKMCPKGLLERYCEGFMDAMVYDAWNLLPKSNGEGGVSGQG